MFRFIQYSNNLCKMALKKFKKKIPKKLKDTPMPDDFDAPNTVNKSAASADYTQDIFNLYRLKEGKCQAYAYMSMQTEINDRIRTVLVDWMIMAQMHYDLEQETFYLAVNIIDRFLSKETVPLIQLKLLAFTALSLACKYEEQSPLEAAREIWTAWERDYLPLSNWTYSAKQVHAMEEKILHKLRWNLTVTTPYDFIHCYLKACKKADTRMKNMVCFLVELAVMHYDSLKYSPSMVAASAVYVVRCNLHEKPNWSRTLECYTWYSEEQLRDCAGLIEKLHKMPAKEMPKAIHTKYSVTARDRVALLPPVSSEFKWNLRQRK